MRVIGYEVSEDGRPRRGARPGRVFADAEPGLAPVIAAA
jgi:hypothetical protein